MRLIDASQGKRKPDCHARRVRALIAVVSIRHRIELGERLGKAAQGRIAHVTPQTQHYSLDNYHHKQKRPPGAGHDYIPFWIIVGNGPRAGYLRTTKDRLDSRLLL